MFTKQTMTYYGKIKYNNETIKTKKLQRQLSSIYIYTVTSLIDMYVRSDHVHISRNSELSSYVDTRGGLASLPRQI